MAAGSKVQQTAQRWYQSKRVPLYVVVGATVSTAATYMFSHGSTPGVSSSYVPFRDNACAVEAGFIQSHQRQSRLGGRHPDS